MAAPTPPQGAGTEVETTYASMPASPSSPRGKKGTGPLSPSKAGRTDWVLLTPSPGPGAYNPAMNSVQTAAERAVFGTAYREQEEKRFVSNLHNMGIPNGDTPGPGAYRTAENRMLGNDKSSKFGTAAQRVEVSKESMGKPGPVYDLPSTLSTMSVGFGSPPVTARAGSRSARGSSPLRDPRSMMSERFPLEHMDTPGPNSYMLIPADKMSHHDTAPRFGFGRATREAATRSSLTHQQMQADPTVGSANDSPGAAYELRSTLQSAQSTIFSKGPAHFCPEKGGNSKGPYLGKLHADANKGIESPGPGAYPTSSTLQSAGGAKFGPASPTRTPKPNEMDVPGPGAHNPNFGAMSVRPASSAFSMGANIRTDFTTMAPNTPGPAAYALPSPDRTSQGTSSPAYSMGVTGSGGRTSYVPRNTNPAPDNYGRPVDPRDQSPTKKGYSFGLRERTKSDVSTITNRYHGPLAALESMGTESPGPGCYDCPSPIARAGSPATRFGTSGRDSGSKMYISSLHSSAEGFGVASPGPGCYNVADGGVMAGSPSRFRAKVAPKFGTSPRFNDKVSTK